MTNFTGVSDPYEEPLAPELVVDSGAETVAVSVARVVDAVNHHSGARLRVAAG